MKCELLLLLLLLLMMLLLLLLLLKLLLVLVGLMGLQAFDELLFGAALGHLALDTLVAQLVHVHVTKRGRLLLWLLLLLLLLRLWLLARLPHQRRRVGRGRRGRCGSSSKRLRRR